MNNNTNSTKPSTNSLLNFFLSSSSSKSSSSSSSDQCMAANNILNLDVSELCLGKPAIRSISASATVAEALVALKTLAETSLSVWSCNFSGICSCVGKISVSDVVCFLAREDSLNSPATALQSPISDLLPKPSGLVSHLEPNASFVEAIDLILGGATNIVIPIGSFSKNKKNGDHHHHRHNGKEYCWITQEDIIRYLLNCIGLFSRSAAASLASLGLVEFSQSAVLLHDSPATSALCHVALSAVAVVDEENRLIGEISPAALDSLAEEYSGAAAALAVLSAGEMMAFVTRESAPPEDLAGAVRERLEERGHVAALDWLDDEEDEDEGLLSLTSSSSSLMSCSSEEEYSGGRRNNKGRNNVRQCEAVVCRPWSSLAAAMIQALSHRSGYVWVVEEDGKLAGIVTFAGMLKVFRERLYSMSS